MFYRQLKNLLIWRVKCYPVGLWVPINIPRVQSKLEGHWWSNSSESGRSKQQKTWTRRREQVCRFYAIMSTITQIWRHDWRVKIGKSVKNRPKTRKILCFHNKRHSWFIKHDSYQYSQRDFSFRWSFTSRFSGKSWKNFLKFLFITEVMLFTNNKTNCYKKARFSSSKTYSKIYKNICYFKFL